MVLNCKHFSVITISRVTLAWTANDRWHERLPQGCHIYQVSVAVCALSLRVSSVLCHTQQLKHFLSAVKRELIIENSDYNYVRSELNMPANRSFLLWGETTEVLRDDWFSTDLFWRIIQSATGDISSPGSDSQINTVYSSPFMLPQRWSLRYNMLFWETYTERYTVWCHC